MLESLIRPITLKDFWQDWPDRFSIYHGELSRLPHFFQQEIFQSTDKLVSAYKGNVMLAESNQAAQMYPMEQGGSIADKLAKGMTVYLGDIAPVVAGTNEFLRELEMDFGIEVGAARMGVFISTDTKGAPCHYDIEDVISIQLMGTKVWHVSKVEQVRYPYGIQYHPDVAPFNDLYLQAANGFPLWNDKNKTLEVKPGSVFCMPRGTWHQTTASGLSMSVSIILKPQTRMDEALEWLKTQLLQQEQWRKPLYGNQKVTVAEIQQLIEEFKDRKLYRTHELSTFSEAHRFCSVPISRIIISDVQSDRCQLEIQRKNQQAQYMSTARMVVPLDTKEIFEWLATKKGFYNSKQVQNAFPKIAKENINEVLQIAEKGGLLRKLWFE